MQNENIDPHWYTSVSPFPFTRAAAFKRSWLAAKKKTAIFALLSGIKCGNILDSRRKTAQQIKHVIQFHCELKYSGNTWCRAPKEETQTGPPMLAPVLPCQMPERQLWPGSFCKNWTTARKELRVSQVTRHETLQLLKIVAFVSYCILWCRNTQ